MGGGFEDDSAEQASAGWSTRTSPTTTSARSRWCSGRRSAAIPTTRRARTWRWSTRTCTRRWRSRCSRPRTSCSSEHNYRRPVYIAHVNGGVARVAKTKAVDTAESSAVLRPQRLRLVGAAVRAREGARARRRRHDGQARRDRRRQAADDPARRPARRAAQDAVDAAALGGGRRRLDRAHVVDGELKLGPESQGAFPGPACYDLGGREATLTDAFVAAGMLNPDRFLGGRRALRVDLAKRRCSATSAAIDAAERVIDIAADMVADGRARHARARAGGRLRALLLRRQRRELRRARRASASASTARTCSRSARC